MSYDRMSLEGKTALITGGNGGIGYGMAEALAQAGADVAIWGRNEGKTEKAAEQLRETGRKIFGLKCDVSSEEEVEAGFAKTVEALGKVDSCFANSGVGGAGAAFVDTTLEDWRRVFSVNMEGVFLTFRSAARHMIERGDGGSLVVTSSSSAIFGAPRNEAYASTKAGVNAMIRGLAVELARHGIRANSILPGWIETAMTERTFGNPKFVANVLKRVPQRRWGKWDDFGGIAVYLASDASAYHSGDEFCIDGGYKVF